MNSDCTAYMGNVFALDFVITDSVHCSSTYASRMLTEELGVLRKDLSESRSAHSRATAQLEFSEERFKVLTSNAESYKREAEALRERSAKYSSLLVKHEETITALRSEVMSTQDRLAKAEVSTSTTHVRFYFHVCLLSFSCTCMYVFLLVLVSLSRSLHLWCPCCFSSFISFPSPSSSEFS